MKGRKHSIIHFASSVDSYSGRARQTIVEIESRDCLDEPIFLTMPRNTDLIKKKKRSPVLLPKS